MAPINGTNGDEFIVGTSGDDDINAKKGDDTIQGGLGDDSLDGKQGFDTAVYDGSIFDYLVTSAPGNKTYVTDQNLANGDEGTDLLQRIEAIEFDDYTLLIDGSNNGPLVVAGDQTTDEDSASAFSIEAYDFDGDALSLDDVTYGGLGVLTLVSTTSLSPAFGSGVSYNFNFDPNGAYENLGVGQSVTETVSIQVSDGQGGTQTITFDITIDGVNDAPIAVDDSATTDEDTPVVVSVLGNDTDVDDGDVLSVSEASAANGQVTINGDGTLTYTPDENFNGTDTITYTVSDGNGGFDEGEVEVTVNPVNDAPVANNDTATTDEDVATVINVLGNDTDVENDTLTVTAASADNGGVVINGDGTLTYTPDENFNGTDTITYEISDGNGGFDTATVTVTVDPVNDAPVAEDDVGETDEGVAVVINVLDNDSDVDGDELTITDASAENGEVEINEDGTLTYTPNEGFDGEDVITYEVSDPGGLSDTATVAVTVNNVNDDPIAGTDEATVDEDDSVIIDILANDSDPDGDPITLDSISAGNGTVEVNEDGTITYTPDPNFNGPDTITYEISDGAGGSATGTVNVTVNPVNDAPDTTDPDDPAFTFNEVDGAASVDLISRTSDIDGDNVTVTSARLVEAETGSPLDVVVTLVDGVATFDPADLGLGNGETLNVRMQYTATDDSGAPNDSSFGFVNLTINGFEVVEPENQAPTAGLLDLTEGDAFEESDGQMSVDIGSVISDPDGDELTVISLIDGEGQEVAFTQVGTTLMFDPQAFGLDDGESGQIDLVFIIDDGSGAENSTAEGGIRFNLNGAEDAPPPDPDNTMPVAAAVALMANEVDGLIVIDLNAQVSDADIGDILTITNVNPNGEFPVEFTLEEGILTIDPASFGLSDEEVETFEFTYTVEDDSGEANSSATGTISVEITGFTEDDPPEPDPVVTLDFEPFSSEVDAAIDITGEIYQGFSFVGSAVVLETDELAGGGGREPNGIIGGQTTPGGDNVLIGTFSTVDVPLLDESGEPILDEETGEPLTEAVPDQNFGVFGPGSTFDFDDFGVFISSGLAGTPPPPLAEIPEEFGSSFNLDAVSMNAPSGGSMTITVTTYTVGVVEVPDAFNPSFSAYYMDLVELDTFEFVVDSTTGATTFDFNDPAFMDALGNTNAAGFDDIYAISFESDDGTAMVFDDFVFTV